MEKERNSKDNLLILDPHNENYMFQIEKAISKGQVVIF